ncbi:MAG: right-handed parallel beta-helix repeat-containing protein [Planctomycetes bacterium]|nr:right-handed parallel beta-helix repeat-containing protein [Planctomycetota bacterium]
MLSSRRLTCLLVVGSLVAVAVSATADDKGRTVKVKSTVELRSALAAAKAGTRIEVAAGTYEGDLFAAGLRGTTAAPIVIAGADAKNPPLIRGGANGIQLTDPEHVELRDLAFSGQTGNGINVDDGGTFDTPAHHVVLLRVTVTDVGPKGNRDGIKLSGVEDFRLDACTVERWGSGGSAVDMVGCRRGVIEGCTFRNTDDNSGDNAVQTKGATENVTIRRNRFDHAGGRAVNIGGSTGLEFFRPPLERWTRPKFEAKDIRVEGNTFTGSMAPIAFVGVDGAVVRWNTFHLPGRWAMRILRETNAPDFVPTQNGEFTDNIVVFRSDRWSEGGVNVGPGTAPETFKFERNAWLCEDAPGRTRELVRLPVAEKDGVYGRDPKFTDAEKGDFTLKPGSPAAKAGATAFKE